MRLDKFLCECGCGSRSEVKQFIKKGRVTINGETVTRPEHGVAETADTVCLDAKAVNYQKFVYFMLHKPTGCVSATKDNVSHTVMELLSKEDFREDLFPVGRLDKDTEGLLLLTNDGELAHKLLSPRKHVPKTYFVKTAQKITKEACCLLEAGVDIGEEKITLPAKVEVLGEKEIELTIMEGKFHQVKRMLQAVSNEVVYLKRLSMGSLLLDKNLSAGEYRPLTESEIKKLCWKI